jgi:hypothetical protein
MAVSETPPDDNEDEPPAHPRVPTPELEDSVKMIREDEREWVEAVIYDAENENAWIESSLVVGPGLMR